MAAVGAGAVDQVVLEHERGDPGGPGDVEDLGELGGVHVRLEDAERGLDLAGCAEPGLDAVGEGDGVEAVALGDQHREPGVEPLDDLDDARVGRLAEGEHQAGQGDRAGGVRGARGDQQVGPVARGDQQRPVGQVLQDGGDVRGADDIVQHVAVERAGSAGEDRRVQRVGDLADRGRRDRRDLGNGPVGNRQPGRRAIGDGRRNPVGDHRGDRRAEVAQRVVRTPDGGRERLATATGAAHHRDHHTAELGRQAGVEGQLAGQLVADLVGGVEEVAADDHDGGALPLGRAVTLDDPADQLLPPAVRDQRRRLGHGDPERVGQGHRPLITLPDRGQQRITIHRRHQRPEHRHAGDLPGQQLDDPQGDRALTDTRAQARYIDTPRHALNLPAGREHRRAEGPACG